MIGYSFEIKEIIKNLNRLKSGTFESREAEERFYAIATEIIERLNLNDRAFALDYIFPLISKSLSTIFDYIDDDFVVVVDEAKMVYDAILKVENEYTERKNDLAKTGEVLNCKELGIMSADKLLEKIHCKWSARTIDNVGLIVLFVGFGAYVLRCIIIFTTQ